VITPFVLDKTITVNKQNQKKRPYFPILKNITHAQKDCNGFGEDLRKNISFYGLSCA
jgi:hypothetical protein